MQQTGNNRVNAKLLLLFLVAAAADITSILLKIEWLHTIAKPLLLPLLLLAAFTGTPPASKHKKLFIAALFFSWAGDVFLLFENSNSLFFIFGLASFLTTHVLYIIYFLGIQSTAISLLKKQPLLIVAVLLYGAALVWMLFPFLGDLKIPVMVYAAVICSMLLCSLHICYKVNRKVATPFIAGALLFVISDSLLAINKFYQPFAMSGVCVMLTYCAAQYLIVKGFIKQNNP